MKKTYFSNTARLITLALLVAPTLTWANDCEQADQLYNRSFNVEQDLLKVLDWCPNHVQALNNLGALQEEHGQLSEAKTLYQRAIAANPNFAPPYAGLGDVLLKQPNKDYRQAAEMFDQFLMKAQGDPALQPYLQRYEKRLEQAQDHITVSAAEIETALTLKRTIGPPKMDVPIHFATNSSKVDKKARLHCKEMAEAIKKVLNTAGLQDSQIRIDGHTDNQGSAAYNQWLSEQRATSVKKVLVKDFNVPANRLITIGQGEYKPTASNNTPHGRFKNRRVTLVRMDK